MYRLTFKDRIGGLASVLALLLVLAASGTALGQCDPAKLFEPDQQFATGSQVCLAPQ